VNLQKEEFVRGEREQKGSWLLLQGGKLCAAAPRTTPALARHDKLCGSVAQGPSRVPSGAAASRT
jgi:hypothetical protein